MAGLMNDDGRRLETAKRKAMDSVRDLAAIYDEWATDADRESHNFGDYFRGRAKEVRECIDRIEG